MCVYFHTIQCKSVLPGWRHECSLKNWGLVIWDWCFGGRMETSSVCKRVKKIKGTSKNILKTICTYSKGANKQMLTTIYESNYSVVIQTLHFSFLFWKIVPCRDLNPGPPCEKQMTYQCATVLLCVIHMYTTTDFVIYLFFLYCIAPCMYYK